MQRVLPVCVTKDKEGAALREGLFLSGLTGLGYPARSCGSFPLHLRMSWGSSIMFLLLLALLPLALVLFYYQHSKRSTLHPLPPISCFPLLSQIYYTIVQVVIHNCLEMLVEISLLESLEPNRVYLQNVYHHVYRSYEQNTQLIAHNISPNMLTRPELTQYMLFCNVLNQPPFFYRKRLLNQKTKLFVQIVIFFFKLYYV